jgi:mannose-6-phosphate isomerase-like protein (cupin superfamily)
MLKPLLVAGGLAMTMAAVYAQNVPTATCKGCPAAYISNDELQAYLKRAIARNQIDQQVHRSTSARAASRSAWSIAPSSTPPAEFVAEHDLSEVYHIISGSATLVTGPDLVGAERRRRRMRTSGRTALARSRVDPRRRDASTEAGDAIIIPAGTGHLFTKIDDQITYLMIRIDPDKVVPWKDEAASKAYLAQQ